MHEFDDDDDSFDDEASEWSSNDDHTIDLISCPNCHHQIYEDSPRCPHCGEYVETSTAVWQNKPQWVRWLAWTLLALAAIGFIAASVF